MYRARGARGLRGRPGEKGAKIVVGPERERKRETQRVEGAS